MVTDSLHCPVWRDVYHDRSLCALPTESFLQRKDEWRCGLTTSFSVVHQKSEFKWRLTLLCEEYASDRWRRQFWGCCKFSIRSRELLEKRSRGWFSLFTSYGFTSKSGRTKVYHIREGIREIFTFSVPPSSSIDAAYFSQSDWSVATFFPNFQQIPRFRSDPPSCARASDWSVKCYGESNFCWRRHPLHSSSYFIGYVMVAWLELICWCRFYFKLGEAQGLEAHGLHALSSCVINTKDRGVRVITPILARTRLPLLTSVPVSFRQPSSIKPMCVALQGISHGAQECGLFLERVN